MSIMGRIRETALSVEEWCMAYAAFVLALSGQLADGTSQSLFGGLLTERQHANVDSVITVVVIGVVAIVGILIYYQVDSTVEIGGDLSSSASEVTTGFGDAMELVPIVMIVLIAAVVIGVIAQFRRSN